MELNSSCRKVRYRDTFVIDTKRCSLLSRNYVYVLAVYIWQALCTRNCIVIAHDWLSLARGVISLLYLSFGVLTHPLSLRGAGALVNTVGELLTFCESSSLVSSLFATSVSVRLVSGAFAAKGRLLTL